MDRIGTESDDGCTTCRFWAAIGEEGSGLGECRRYAPAPFPRSVLNIKRLDADAPEHDAMWPVTGMDDWCGDWECKMR